MEALFWDDPVGDLQTYVFERRPWANKTIVIAHNANAFDLHFLLNRAIVRNGRLNVSRTV